MNIALTKQIAEEVVGLMTPSSIVYCTNMYGVTTERYELNRDDIDVESLQYMLNEYDIYDYDVLTDNDLIDLVILTKDGERSEPEVLEGTILEGPSESEALNNITTQTKGGKGMKVTLEVHNGRFIAVGAKGKEYDVILDKSFNAYLEEMETESVNFHTLELKEENLNLNAQIKELQEQLSKGRKYYRDLKAKYNTLKEESKPVTKALKVQSGLSYCCYVDGCTNHIPDKVAKFCIDRGVAVHCYEHQKGVVR